MNYLLQAQSTSDNTGIIIILTLITIVFVRSWWSDKKEQMQPILQQRTLFQRAIKTKNPDVIHDIAMKYANPETADKALFYLTKALEVNPNHFKSRLDKIIILNGEGRYFEARNLMEGFVEQNPSGDFDVKEEYGDRIPIEIKAHILYFYGYIKNAEGQFAEAEYLKAKAMQYSNGVKGDLY